MATVMTVTEYIECEHARLRPLELALQKTPVDLRALFDVMWQEVPEPDWTDAQKRFAQEYWKSGQARLRALVKKHVPAKKNRVHGCYGDLIDISGLCGGEYNPTSAAQRRAFAKDVKTAFGLTSINELRDLIDQERYLVPLVLLHPEARKWIERKMAYLFADLGADDAGAASARMHHLAKFAQDFLVRQFHAD